VPATKIFGELKNMNTLPGSFMGFTSCEKKAFSLPSLALE
jgi:hypothetical protein